MKRLLILVLLLFSAAMVSAQNDGHLVLLTVAETETGRIGGTADLHLKVREGTGRIFIDSFPLTKLDTQISTRFANEIACKQLDLGCSRYDFFYTIQADSTIVGGPSAGAGVAVLTAAVMKNLDLDDNIAMTGTINSGGIVGPIAGVNEKILAAQRRGLNKVIIPKWMSFNKSSFENMTGTELTIEVSKVGNFEEALAEFTSYVPEEENGEIEILERYSERMRSVATILCNRTSNLEDNIEDINETLQINFTQKREAAFEAERYYSAASYCFTRNIELKSQLLENRNDDILQDRLDDVKEAIETLNNNLEGQELRTLSDLETYSIVKERLVDAEQSIELIEGVNISSTILGYVEERYFSAIAWSKFFGLGGRAFELEEGHLLQACIKKLSEAEERLDYVSTISPTALMNTREDLDLAKKDRSQGDYALCIFKSTKIKAEADTFMLAITADLNNIQELVDEKLQATKRVILAQQEQGIFPILGYSYYEYADSLKSENPSSALLFSEYALEMSNLDLYFPQTETSRMILPSIDKQKFYMLLIGLFIGFGVGVATTAVLLSKRNKPKKTRKGLPRKKR